MDNSIWEPYNEQLKSISETNIAKGTLKREFFLKHLANALNSKGYLETAKNNYPKSVEYYQMSLKIRGEIGDKSGMATCLNNIGNVYQIQGNISKTLEYFNKSLKIRGEIGNKNGMANTFTDLGNVYKNLGDIPKALEYYNKSLMICEEIGIKLEQDYLY